MSSLPTTARRFDLRSSVVRLRTVAAGVAFVVALGWPAPVRAQDLRELVEGFLGQSRGGSESEEPAAATPIELLQRKSVQEELKLNGDQLPRIEAIIEEQKRLVSEFDSAQKAQYRGAERILKATEIAEALRLKTAETQADAEQRILQLLDDDQRRILEQRLQDAPAAQSAPVEAPARTVQAAPAAPAGRDASSGRDAAPSRTGDRGSRSGTFGRGGALTPTQSPASSTPSRTATPTPSSSSPRPPLRDPNVKIIASFAAASIEEVAAYSRGDSRQLAQAQPGGVAPEAGAGDAASPVPAPTEAPAATRPMADAPASAGIQRVPGNGAAGKLSFNFRNAPWTDVLKLFAEAAGLTLNMRHVPPGDFTYLDRQHYTPTEALDLMNRYLFAENFLLLRNDRDRFLTVVNLASGVPSHLVETVELHELSQRGRYDLVRVDLPIKDHDPTKALNSVRSQLTKGGVVTLLETGNTIVVTDIAENLIRIRNVMGIAGPVAGLTFQRFPLRHIPADEAATLLRKMFRISTTTPNFGGGSERSSDRSRFGDRGRGGDRSRGGGGEDPRAEFFRRMMGGGDDNDRDRGGSSNDSGPPPADSPASRNATVESHAGTNSVLVTATSADMKLAEQILVSLDIDPRNEPGFAGRDMVGQAFLQVYDVTSADPTKVAETLETLHPGTVRNVDSSSKRIHVVATASQHQEITTQIRQFDGAMAGESLTLVPLRGVNGFGVAQAFKELYVNDTATAPSVQVDPSGQHLIVRGSQSQAMQIDALVQQMAANGGGGHQPNGSRLFTEYDSAVSPVVERMIAELFPQVQVEEAVQTPASQAAGATRRGTTATRGGTTGRGTATRGGFNAGDNRGGTTTRTPQAGGANLNRFGGGAGGWGQRGGAGGEQRGGQQRGGRGGR
ncbi:MAG: secretin N-terminal domain-containing protein [Planctomycetaceae bacterium]